MCFALVGIAVVAYEPGAMAVMGFDVAGGSLDDERATGSDRQAALMGASEFAFGNAGFDEVSGLKAVDALLPGEPGSGEPESIESGALVTTAACGFD